MRQLKRTDKCITGKHYLYYTNPSIQKYTVLKFLRWGVASSAEVHKNLLIFHDLVTDKDVMFFPDAFYEIEDYEVDNYLMMQELVS